MWRGFAVPLTGLCLAWPALADDTLRIAVGQRGLWDTSVPELGQRGGIFKKHGIALDILYTQGGGETQQAVISGSVDLGTSAGILGVFGAYAKGAPLRIIGAEMTGGGDLFWYVPREFADPHPGRTPTARPSPIPPMAPPPTPSSPPSSGSTTSRRSRSRPVVRRPP